MSTSTARPRKRGHQLGNPLVSSRSFESLDWPPVRTVLLRVKLIAHRRRVRMNAIEGRMTKGGRTMLSP